MIVQCIDIVRKNHILYKRMEMLLETGMIWM